MKRSIVEITNNNARIRLRHTLISIIYHWNEEDQLWHIRGNKYKDIKGTLTQKELDVVILTDDFYRLVEGPCPEERTKQLSDEWYKTFIQDAFKKKDSILHNKIYNLIR